MATTLPKRRKLLWYGIERALKTEWQRRWDSPNGGQQLHVLMANVVDGRFPVDASDADRATLSLVAKSLLGHFHFGAWSPLWSAQLHLCAGSPHSWDPQLEAYPNGDSDPGGPNDTRRIITNQKQQIKYPCYRSRDTQSLKDKQMHDNVQFTLVQGYNDSDNDTASNKEPIA